MTLSTDKYEIIAQKGRYSTTKEDNELSSMKYIICVKNQSNMPDFYVRVWIGLLFVFFKKKTKYQNTKGTKKNNKTQ